MDLATKLVKITEEAGQLEKTGQAPDKIGGFRFHAIDAVEDHLRPLLVKYKVATLVSSEDYQYEVLPDTGRRGGQILCTCRVCVTFVDSEEPKHTYTCCTHGQGLDSGDKAAGKAISYAVKALYLNVFHLKGQPDNEQDAVEVETAPQPESPEPQHSQSGQLRAYLRALLEHRGQKSTIGNADALIKEITGGRYKTSKPVLNSEEKSAEVLEMCKHFDPETTE